MSILPTKILLATDGSKKAHLALTTAADMAKSSNSEPHVAYVFFRASATCREHWANDG
jgi:nucleotide-binding universal stress UspA family protein